MYFNLTFNLKIFQYIIIHFLDQKRVMHVRYRISIVSMEKNVVKTSIDVKLKEKLIRRNAIRPYPNAIDMTWRKLTGDNTISKCRFFSFGGNDHFSEESGGFGVDKNKYKINI